MGKYSETETVTDRKIQVVNRCRKGSLDGPLKESKGKAEVADTATNAKLKVWFFWPFKGNYWIIDLNPDYQWAVVGEPSRKYLWILSRTPTMDDAVYQKILGRLPQKGYNPAGLRKTAQVGNLFDLKPGERGLEQANGGPIWTFTADYIDRLRAALVKARSN